MILVIGSSVVVRSLTSAPSVPDTFIVGGTFTTAGALPCEAVCSWNSADKQWRALGTGVRGEVAAVDYAGVSPPSLSPQWTKRSLVFFLQNNNEVLIIAGALTLADGTEANVAKYSFENMTWSALGTTPGPVTAVGVNNGNSSSIFAAGKLVFNLFWLHRRLLICF